MTLTRRNLLQATPGAVIGMSAISSFAFGQSSGIRPAKAPTLQKPNSNIIKGYGVAQRNLVSLIHGRGASAADFREMQVTTSLLYGELQTSGTGKYIDTTIQSKASAIKSFDPSTINIDSTVERLKAFAPFTPSDIASAKAAITPQAKTTLIQQGVSPSIQAFTQLLSTAEKHAGSGVLSASYATTRGIAHYQEADVCAPALIAGVLALGAIFAPEIEIGILFDVAIDGQDVIGMLSAMYSIIAVFVC